MSGALTNIASVLTTDAEAEGVTDTTVHVHLLHAFKIFAKLDINGVGSEVFGLAVLDVALAIDEPRGDLVLQGISDDVGDLFDFSGGEGTSTAVVVDTSLLADEEGHADTDTLDHAEGVGDLTLTVNVGVEETDDVGEGIRLDFQGHFVVVCFLYKTL